MRNFPTIAKLLTLIGLAGSIKDSPQINSEVIQLLNPKTAISQPIAPETNPANSLPAIIEEQEPDPEELVVYSSPSWHPTRGTRKAPATPRQHYDRELTLPFDNPLESSEANTALRYSFSQLSGKLTDYLGDQGLDNVLAGRIGLWIFNGGLNHAAESTSHEFRHITEGNKVGDFSTDFTLRTFFPFTSNFDLKVRLPKTIDERLRIDLAGVNQNYENARNFWRNTFLRNNGEIVWDQGTSFAIAQSWHSWYHLVDLIDNDNTGDMNNYAKLLNLKGIGLTEKEATLESFFPLLASWHTYQSIFSSIQYMATGEKSVTATTFNVGSLELTPPYFALYLTPEGNFLNTSLLVNPSSDYPLEVSVGNHLDMFGGEVDTFRFGAQLHNITFFEGKSQFRVSPFVYLNTSGELNPKGFSLGTELIKPLTQWAEISVNLGYHQDDILERTIKGKDNGFNATGNLTLRF